MFFKKRKLYYIVESAEWSIKWDGRYITELINSRYSLKSKIRESHEKIRNSIIHFGSRNLYFNTNAYQGIHRSNKVIFTWFHGTEDDLNFISALPEGAKNADIIHTSCLISRNQLIKWGADPGKIKVIPLGVDTSKFMPTTVKEGQTYHNQLGIPNEHIVIGSFQKDGNGWGEGLEPKLIKGPDIFCDVVEQLNTRHPIFVLLTGPARGYVKHRLEQARVPYKHVFLKNYLDIAKYYNLLDLYLITSRAEGGPKALLEAWSSGVPVVATQVGMCNDLIKNGQNGLLTDVNNQSTLVTHAENIIQNKSLANQLAKEGLTTVQKYSWNNIVQQYYDQIYSRFI